MDGRASPYVTAPSGTDPLNAAVDRVKMHARRMEVAMEKDDIRSVLKAASDMLWELSSTQSPKNYSTLYAEVFTHVQQLPYYFQDYVAQGNDTFESLYTVMQHPGHVLPRLYLMIICAGCAIRADPSQVHFYLNDLLDFSKGIQHPMRGLFLRSFLNTTIKPLLPDQGKGNEDELANGEGKDSSATSTQGVSSGTGKDSTAMLSITFLLRNFSEMNKLWTRMQRNAPQSEARDTMRMQLSELVGKNLDHLANLNGLHFKHYQQLVLPCVTEQIVQCEDKLAQQYLMEIVILSFPDEYHVRTLSQLLQTCMALQAGVEVHVIMSRLMHRLAEHAVSNAEIMAAGENEHIFRTFLHAAHECGVQNLSMPAYGLVMMFGSLAKLVAVLYKDSDRWLNDIMEHCYSALSARNMELDHNAEEMLLEILGMPLKEFDVDIERLVALDKYPLLLQALRAPQQRRVATDLIARVRSGTACIKSAEQMHWFCDLVAPLVAADLDESLYPEDKEECTTTLAMLVRCIDPSDLEILSDCIRICKAALWTASSSAAHEALGHLWLQALSSHSQSFTEGSSLATHMHFFRASLVVPLEERQPAAALHLLLSGAELADTHNCVDLTTQLLEAAGAVYHRYCSLPPTALDGLAAQIQCLGRLRAVPRKQHDAACEQLCRYAMSLPVQADKVQMLLCASNLYWQDSAMGPTDGIRDDAAVAKVLEEAEQVVDHAEKVYHGEKYNNPAQLYMDILDAIRCLTTRGCDLQEVKQRCLGNVKRLASDGCSVLAMNHGSLSCWNDQLQSRFEAFVV